MAILSRELLDNLGITLDNETYTALSDHFDTTLQSRVIEEVVDSLTPEKASELATLQGNANDQQILEWLQANVKDFAEIISDEVDILLGEIAENSDALSADGN